MRHAMTPEQLRAACAALTGAVEERPFRDPEITVFKVGGKIFAITRLEGNPLRVSLKCDPDLAEQLRLTYPAIQPGYHLNKRHWNTIVLDGSLDDAMVRDLIEDSYALVAPRRMGDPGLEPGTSSLSEKRSNRLS
jgi:predicted DNA-binding protein (MmcQ/YjbR family)